MIDILAAHPATLRATLQALEALGSIDDAIHQKARMGIMSLLLALGEGDFKLLKETLSLSDGNLSTHLTLLEDRGYIDVHKEFVRKKPRTTYRPSDTGAQCVPPLHSCARSSRSFALSGSVHACGDENPQDVVPRD